MFQTADSLLGVVCEKVLLVFLAQVASMGYEQQLISLSLSVQGAVISFDVSPGPTGAINRAACFGS